jgi:hypothetical protein
MQVYPWTFADGEGIRIGKSPRCPLGCDCEGSCFACESDLTGIERGGPFVRFDHFPRISEIDNRTLITLDTSSSLVSLTSTSIFPHLQPRLIS